MSKKWIVALFLVAALFGVSACSSSDEGAGKSPDKQASSPADPSSPSQQPSGPPSQQQPPEPDVKNVPAVVAEVDKTKITKEEFVLAYKGQFQQAAMQSQSTGQQVDQKKLKKQVAESMVGTQLLTHEADKRGVKASKKDIDQTLEAAAKQNGLKSKKELLAALKKQGMSAKQVNADVVRQVKINRLTAAEAGSAEPSEKELKKLYKQVIKQQEQSGQQSPGTKPPSYKEMKPQLKQQAQSQKQGEVAQSMIKKLRKKADVKIHV